MNPLDLAAAVPDPRQFPAVPAAAADLPLYRRAEESLEASTRLAAQAVDAKLSRDLADRLAGEGAQLARLVDGAPSVAVARHLWRLIDGVSSEPSGGGTLAVTVFALPLVLVAGLAATRGEATLAGVLADVEAIAELLRRHGALAGNRSIAFANVLAGAEALDLARLPEILAWQRLPGAGEAAAPPRAVRPAPIRVGAGPAPIRVGAGNESVHLRFLLGTALARPGAVLFGARTTEPWGMPLAQAMGREVAAANVSLLALPRPPGRPLVALDDGRSAQREVSAQLFASNAIRKLRASVGEPGAVISAHRSPEVRAGGELRLSLSSPFEPRDAEGFRCPLFATDRVGDVVAMLVRLLQDCRVADIRLLDGVHPDRVAGTTHPLLYKPETIPQGAELRRH
jgi:hypothetical protein